MSELQRLLNDPRFRPAERLKQELGAEMIFYGFGSMDCNAHAPNEWLRVDDFHLGVRAYCAYLEALGVRR